MRPSAYQWVSIPTPEDDAAWEAAKREAPLPWIKDAPASTTTVEWGNLTPDGDRVPRATERDARRTAANRGWPVVRRAVTITPWERL